MAPISVGMEREAFLDAQLWLRRLPPGDALLALPERCAGSRDDAAALASVLPPPASESQPQSVSWCCFEVAGLTCVFAADERGQDATQLQFELLRAHPSGRQVLRFEKALAYELQAGRVGRIASAAPVPSADQQSGKAAPPWVLLRCGSVNMRVWMDPSQLQPLAAYSLLYENIHFKHERERAHDSEPGAMWKRSLRHSLNIGSDAGERPLLAQSSPKALLAKARAALSSTADFEAAKMVVENITRKRRDKGSDDHALNDCFTDEEMLVLLAEVTRLFGEDHPCVSRLLCITRDDKDAVCGMHERCFKLSDSEGASACASQKWAAWDGFIEKSDIVLLKPRKRRRSDGIPETLGNQAVVDDFSHSIVSSEQSKQCKLRTRDANSQLDAIERSGFRALGLLPQQTEGAASNGIASARTLSNKSQSGREQQVQTAEQLFAALLHQRRELARDALVLELLPHRQCQRQ